MATDPVHAVPGDSSVQAPPSREREIFRSAALEHYRESQNRIVFPRFTTPRVIAYMWILAICFVIAGAAIASRALLPALLPW